jgi:O-succinylbenzoate synthase
MIIPSRLHLREIRLPLREPFRISSGTTQVRRALVVRLEDQDGAAGWAECVAGGHPDYSPETVETAWLAMREWIAPLVLGHPFAAPADIYPHLEESIRGHRMARAAVEMAAWDLAARRTGLSLSTALGGTRSRVEVGISLGLQQTPDRLGALAAEAAGIGYHRIKVKIAPGRDIDDVAAARDAIGIDFPLSADANAAYRPEDTDHLKRLDAFGLVMLEQPFDHEDLVRHALLRRTLATPLCLDESISSPERAADLIALRSADIINVKPGRVGGLAASLAIHELGIRHGIPMWCGGMLETGIGRAHNVALASLPGFELPGDLSPSARYWARDIVDPEWTMHDGTLEVPQDRAGIGVEIDTDFLDHCTVRSEELVAQSSAP